jgi:hypothetical protein
MPVNKSISEAVTWPGSIPSYHVKDIGYYYKFFVTPSNLGKLRVMDQFMAKNRSI